MGYPWLDASTKTIRVSVANSQGEQEAAAEAAALASPGWTLVTADASASISKLDQIQDDATRLVEAGVPDANLIWMTEPDQLNNRVIITVSQLDETLLLALAARYGTQLIEVRIQPNGQATSASRDDDYPPFWGGAAWTSSAGLGCTTGFPWKTGSTYAMLTAGHCMPTSGYASWPHYPNAGTVSGVHEENWDTTYGSQYFYLQSVYRGDLALIRLGSSYTSGYEVYSGAAHTSTARYVEKISPTWAKSGDLMCSSGVTTGEWCGAVDGVARDIWYSLAGPHVWARHMDTAVPDGTLSCPDHGDSGGPVYHKLADGKVSAVGIFSGFTTFLECQIFFTDIWDAYYGLPGTVLVTG